MDPVLLIGGPTAAGKSGLSLAIAQAYGAAVVSADAMTVWRGLDIGTAKPTAEERMRVPHYCVDVRDIGEEYNVSDFVAAVDDARETHERVIIAGGTPFWLAALLRPHAELPAPDLALRAELEQLDAPWQALQAVDPAMAGRLHPNDHVRIIRALEVHRLTGRPMSEVQAGPPARPPIDCELVWLDRDDLRERIGQRLTEMLAGGYLEEVRGALSQGVPPDARPLRAFAYRHLIAHLSDGLPADEALRRTERDTWKLARKQRTWARGLGWTASPPSEAWAAAERLWGPKDLRAPRAPTGDGT